jgi:hypothetical protein
MMLDWSFTMPAHATADITLSVDGSLSASLWNPYQLLYLASQAGLDQTTNSKTQQDNTFQLNGLHVCNLWTGLILDSL